MKFHIKDSTNSEYFWRLVAANGKTVADSGETYKQKSSCESAIAKIKADIAAAPIVDDTTSQNRRY